MEFTPDLPVPLDNYCAWLTLYNFGQMRNLPFTKLSLPVSSVYLIKLPLIFSRTCPINNRKNKKQRFRQSKHLRLLKGSCCVITTKIRTQRSPKLSYMY